MYGTPEQSGVTEKWNHTPMDMLRSMARKINLLKWFWGESLKTALHIFNKVSNKFVSKTPLNYTREENLAYLICIYRVVLLK